MFLRNPDGIGKLKLSNLDKDIEDMQRVIEQRCECCNSLDCHRYRTELAAFKDKIENDSTLGHIRISWHEDFLANATLEEIAKVELQVYLDTLEDVKKLDKLDKLDND